MKNNVVIYLRVSTNSQIDNTSLEMQEDKIRYYCKAFDVNINKVFKDEGLSAKNDNRPKYLEMINYISNKDNNVDGIIVYKSDRIHRSLKNLMIMIDYLNDINLSFLSVTEQFDTSTAQGLLFLQMLGSFSEFERKLIAERTRSGRVAKGENELYAGGRVPFGYELIQEKMVINYEQIEIIKDIFKMRCKGLSYNKIADKYGMSKQRVSYILKNKIYLGKYNYNGKIEHNKINFDVPRIITSYTYNKANSINNK